MPPPYPPASSSTRSGVPNSAHFHFQPYFHCLPFPPAANPVSLVPSSCRIWSVSPFPKIGSLLVFARVLLVAPASSLSPTLSSGCLCWWGGPLSFRPQGSLSLPISCALYPGLSAVSTLHPHLSVSAPSTCYCSGPTGEWGEGRGGDSQGLRERVKVLLWWGAGGQHLGGASRPQIRQ